MSNNSSVQCLSDGASKAAVCIYSLIFILGLVFNLIALVVFFGHAKFRSHTTVYMTNLALADVLLILTLPLRIYYHLGFEGLPQWLCDILGLALKANMYGSIFLLTCISFDRCMAVAFPLSRRVQEGRKKAPLFCLGVWMLTFGASLPIYLSKRRMFSKDENCFDNLPSYAIQPAVVLPTLIAGFVVPLVVMSLCSWGLLRAIRRSTAAQTELVDCERIQRMIGTSLFVFLLSFLPYHAILGFLSLVSVSCPKLMAYRYSLMVACLNTVLDPITYYFTTDTFRRNIDVGVVQRMFPLSSHNSLQMNSRSR